ncbi:ribokinase [Parapedobacter composti]|uniref:Ribokinase n=1 Tax=Parapedobacter composti TaxID=623281 RepID=A0A1I1KU52_9SPHI|nr:ribokinase [Parapedobacter composti]SFC64344.1 ribokinase [Parapedobacter composti]
MRESRIIVVGSLNMDMVVQADRIPNPGETVLGGTFFMSTGGKGANQAVAAARLGGNAAMIGKIGRDIFGSRYLQAIQEEGIDIQGIEQDSEEPSGIALVIVERSGENAIVVAPGANAGLRPEDVEQQFHRYPEGKILLLQLEIPMETVVFAAQQAKKRGMLVLLNPAPANDAVTSLFPLIDIITPNLHEAEQMTGVKITDIASAKCAAQYLSAKGVRHVVITLGELGAVLLDDGEFHHVPVPRVTALDTTAAGDVFNGALAAAIIQEKSLVDATAFACKAAAIAVTRLGAQSSIPYLHEVMQYQET